MNVDLGIWSKLTKIVVALVAVAIVLLIGSWYLPLIQENARMRTENLRLEDALQKETEKSKELQAQIDALTHDPKTVERLSREKLSYAKPDETVIHFDPLPTNSATK